MSEQQPTSRRAEPILSELELYSEYRNCDRWAIIVGISRYRYQGWNLKYAERDATELYELLLTPNGGGFKKECICKLVNEEATTSKITQALRSFLKKPDREDLVLIYFACHGTPDFDRQDNLYLLTHDTNPEDVSGTALPMDYIDTALMRKNLLAEKVIVLADTCHSGAIGGGIGRRNTADGSTLVNSYLQAVSRAKGGIALLTSAEANEVSFEDRKWGGGHGVFTYYLLQGMRGAGDRDGNGIVTVGELFEYVRDNVKRATDHRQHPLIGANAYDRDLPVALVPNATFSMTSVDTASSIKADVFRPQPEYHRNSIIQFLRSRIVGVSSIIIIFMSGLFVFLSQSINLSTQWPPDYIPSSTSLTLDDLTLQIKKSNCNLTNVNNKVRKLDQQILFMMKSIHPTSFVDFKKLPVKFNENSSFPYLQLAAVKALEKAINQRGEKLIINSAYRSIAVQQILYNLAQEEQCYKLAAPPGWSNRQSGLAIDIEEPEKWQSFLESEGWQWWGPLDSPHFDFRGPGTDDIRRLPILAFQKLWNLNHPEDKIPEDGEYTPETNERLNQSPIEGFPKGGRAVN